MSENCSSGALGNGALGDRLEETLTLITFNSVDSLSH